MSLFAAVAQVGFWHNADPPEGRVEVRFRVHSVLREARPEDRLLTAADLAPQFRTI